MRKGNDQAFLDKIQEGEKEKGREEVILKATGKAVERLIGVAAWFAGDEGGEKYMVRVRTGSVGAVDDVVGKDGGEEEEGSRVRRVSCLEVGVCLKG
jgi:ribonuclease P/MRP protein subunit POP7